MKNLEDKILKNFKNSIAMSHLEEEFLMKKGLKKQIIILSLVIVVLFTGGFWTVNAVTNGKMVENIKSTVYDMIKVKDNKDIKVDSNSIEIQNIEFDSEGNIESATYTFNTIE